MKLEHTKPLPIGGDQSEVLQQALPQILAVCVKNVLLIGFGMTLGFPTILIPSLSGKDPTKEITMGPDAISWIGSVTLICVPLGCLISGSVTHAIGRKRAMQLVNLPFLTAWLLFYFANEPWLIFLALAVTGFTGGLLEAPVLTYVAEITQPHLRGILSSTSTMSVSFGILTQFLCGTFLTWRNVALVNCSLPIIAFILLMFIPETPIWLITKDRFDEARRSIAWLRGWTTVESIEEEFQELHNQIKTPAQGQSNNNEKVRVSRKSSIFRTLKLFTKKSFLWPYVIVSLAFFLSHFNGTATLGIYAIKIFSVLKAPIDQYYATVIMGVVQLLGSIICVIFVNIIGKRVINIISLIGTSICFIIVATYAFYIDVHYFDNPVTANVTKYQLNYTTNITLIDNSPLESYHWVPVAFLVISAFLTYMGIRVLPWILIGEVYSIEIRASASGVSGGTGYIFGFISNKIFLSLVSSLTLPGVFWLNGCIGLLGAVILYFFLPETEGKGLYEITEHFAGRNKLTNSVRRKKHSPSGRSNPAFEPDDKIKNNESVF